MKKALALRNYYNTSNEAGQTSLHCAVLNKTSTVMVQTLLELGCEINGKDIYGNTPLHVVLFQTSCNIQMVKLLLKHGASVSKTNNDGQTPLHVALEYVSSFEVVNELLKYGADVDAKDMKYRTPLDVVLQNNTENSKIVKKLLSNGACIHEKNKKGETLLHVSIKSGKSLEVIRELLYYGISINSKDGNGNTALHLASSGSIDNLCLVRELLNNGASVHERNRHNQTALHIAVENDLSIEIIRELLKNGAKVNTKDLYNNTPLFNALNSSLQNVEVIKTLLQHGAYIFEKNSLLQTSLHIAIQQEKCLEIIQEILKFGADVNIKDACFRSPLYTALNNPQVNFDTIQILLKYGASVHERDSLSQILVNILVQNKISQQVMKEILRYSLIEHADTIYCIFCNTLFLHCPDHFHYVNELNKMKYDFIVNGLTLYDFVVLKMDYGKHYLEGTDVLVDSQFFNKLISEYPHYFDIIMNTLESRLYLMQKLCDLSFLIQTDDSTNRIININSDCLRVIVKFLSKDELQNLIKAILLKEDKAVIFSRNII